jgi:hypothetical protein
VLVPLLSGTLHAFTWNKLYRRTLLREYGVISPEDMPLMQDIVFNQDAFAVMRKVVYLDRPLYYFRRHSASNTMKFRPDVFDTLVRLLHEKEMCLHKAGIVKEYRGVVQEWFIRQALHVIYMEFSAINALPFAERRERIRRITNDADIRKVLRLTRIKVNWLQEATLFGLRARNTALVVALAIFYNKYMSLGRKVKHSLYRAGRSTSSHV